MGMIVIHALTWENARKLNSSRTFGVGAVCSRYAFAILTFLVADFSRKADIFMTIQLR
jgi:hypothetical protein